MVGRSTRRRPFSSWVKRLANLKASSFDSHSSGGASAKRNPAQHASKSKKSSVSARNNPYPASCSLPGGHGNGNVPASTLASGRTDSLSSFEGGRGSGPPSAGSHNPPTLSNKSTAPTLSTNAETTKSSKAESSGGRTGATTGGGGGSTFSSPAPSERSLTTTLTTVQSTAPSTMLTNGANPNSNNAPTLSQANYSPHHNSNSPSHFSHQFPVTSPPSALPPHLAPLAGVAHPSTYSAATANNLLTDNASILTLASSSKRRRRHSFDTDASVRALAPSSLWGGSRESLPLSVLSGTVGDSTGVGPSTPALMHRPSAATGTERASVYSATGIAPTLGSERNSYYGGRAGDGASVKSGYLGHSRNDSVGGSVNPPASPLIGSREMSSAVGTAGGKVSRRSSGWGEVEEDEEESPRMADGDERDREKDREKEKTMEASE
ncbi:hypothetical protein GP486_002879 [Trichoglossum hirsutum]|uniref:Uncharacterized protein n=1 Tax=Trichoglossum hirsutum TaxID=265104 RepID=A0A9P8RRP1_9PEZI|nr:hypothetical protein GP486_002879 [Trichoglossum hirsutum]